MRLHQVTNITVIPESKGWHPPGMDSRFRGNDGGEWRGGSGGCNKRFRNGYPGYSGDPA